MNTVQINDYLKDLSCYGGAFCRNELPPINIRPCVLIANTDPCSKPGQHWVAMIFNKDGSGEYFDSFGFPPLSEDLLNHLNRYCPIGWKYNNRILQSLDSDVCGLYCILYAKRKCTSRAFYNLFSTDTKLNDALVKLYLSLYTRG